MPKKRIGELDLLRFVFMMVVLLYHFETGTFPFGNIGVEFFFILSGLLMARHAEKWEKTTDGGGRDLTLVANEAWSFLRGKFRSFYTYYLVAFGFNVIVRSIIINRAAAASVAMRLLKSIPTVTLSFFAFSEKTTSYYIYATWYLSAMLIAMLVLYPILLRNYRVGVKIVFPILIIILLGYEYASKERVSLISDWMSFTYFGILRAGSEIALGAVIYNASTEITGNEALMKRAGRRFNQALLTLGKVICFGVVLLYAHQTGFGLKFAKSFDLHALMLCGVGILLSFSGLGWSIPDCKLTRYLAKISVPIYIFHKLLRVTWLEAMGVDEVSAKTNWMMVIVCMAASVALMYVTDFLARGIQKLRASQEKQLAE
jgi:peptidoglycan/LPS O-acetylase OafA/YrhL